MKNKTLYFFACSLALQACSDPAERTAKYLKSGKVYYAEENYPKAKIEFRNALQIDGKLSMAYFHLALIAEKNKNWKGMFANLSRVIQFNPENIEAKLMLTKLFLSSGEIEKASSEIDQVLALDAQNPDAISLKGIVLLKKGENKEALAEADKALAINPAHLESINLKVAQYLAENDYVTAEKVAKVALALNPDALSLHLLKLRVDINAKNTQAVEKDYQELIRRFPEKLQFSYALAKYFVGQGNNSDALYTLQVVIEKNPELIEPKLVLVDYLVQKDRSQAEKTLNQFLQQNPNEASLYFKLADLQIEQQQFEKAKVPLNWVVEHKGEDKEGLSAKALLAKIAMQGNEIETAIILVDDVLAVDAKHYQSLLLKSRLNLVERRYDGAIVQLRSVLRDYPKSDEAMVLLAQAYLKKQSPELAQENFRKAMDINPSNFSAIMPVVSRMIKSKDIGRADDILKKALEIRPNHAGALQALAQVRLLNKDWQGTQEVAELISTKPKGKGFSYYLGGKISEGQGLYTSAIKQYEQALSVTPELSDALTSLAVCYEKLKKPNKILAYLDDFMAKNPNNYAPFLLKAQVYRNNKEWGNALAILNKGAEKWPRVAQFYVLMGSVYSRKNDREKLVESYKRGLEKKPDHVQLSMLLSSVYEIDQDYDKARRIYESLIAKWPSVDLAVNNLVSMLLDHYPGKENTERAVILAKRFEKSKLPYYIDTYGWALLHNNNIKEALPIFQKAVMTAPDVAVFSYHLGVAHHKNNNIAEAIGALKKALILGGKKNGFVEKEQAKDLLQELMALPKAA